MIGVSKLFLIAAVATTVPAIASAANCRAQKPNPWTVNGAVNGDEWAKVYLELDSKGWAKRCLMGDNNIDDSDRRFFVCKYMKEQWRPAKTDDRPKSTTVEQFFLLTGPDHDKASREAREHYLAQHPDVRPECFADD